MINLRSRLTTSLLSFYFANPEQSLYINELAKKLDLDLGNLYRKLKELENEGLLISENKGNQKYYQLNKRFPLLREYKKAFEFTNGPAVELKKILSQVPKIKEAYIFGSYANSSFKADSDIDVLLIGNHSSIEARRKLLPLEKKLQREISCVDMTAREFDDKKHSDDFLKNIFSQKTIKLI